MVEGQFLPEIKGQINYWTGKEDIDYTQVKGAGPFDTIVPGFSISLVKNTDTGKEHFIADTLYREAMANKDDLKDPGNFRIFKLVDGIPVKSFARSVLRDYGVSFRSGRIYKEPTILKSIVTVKLVEHFRSLLRLLKKFSYVFYGVWVVSVGILIKWAVSYKDGFIFKSLSIPAYISFILIILGTFVSGLWLGQEFSALLITLIFNLVLVPMVLFFLLGLSVTVIQKKTIPV